MKTISVVFFVMFACAPLASFCQRLVPTLTLEKTVAGCEYGASVNYQTKRLVSIGAFYQTGLSNNRNDVDSRRNFTGVLVNLPIAKSENINFFIQSRFGFVDEKFFVFTPGVETAIRLVGNVWIHAGSAVRMTYPSFVTSISFKI